MKEGEIIALIVVAGIGYIIYLLWHSLQNFGQGVANLQGAGMALEDNSADAGGDDTSDFIVNSYDAVASELGAIGSYLTGGSSFDQMEQ